MWQVLPEHRPACPFRTGLRTGTLSTMTTTSTQTTARPAPDTAAVAHDPQVPVVTYCWGPGCNGSTRAALALALAQLGDQVQELIGRFEHWAREGLPVQTEAGTTRPSPDALTTPVTSPTCDC